MPSIVTQSEARAARLSYTQPRYAVLSRAENRLGVHVARLREKWLRELARAVNAVRVSDAA